MKEKIKTTFQSHLGQLYRQSLSLASNNTCADERLRERKFGEVSIFFQIYKFFEKILKN